MQKFYKIYSYVNKWIRQTILSMSQQMLTKVAE